MGVGVRGMGVWGCEGGGVRVWVWGCEGAGEYCYPLPFTLYPLPFTLYPLPFTLYPLPFTLFLLSESKTVY